MLELLLFLGASIFGGALLWVLDPIVCFFDNTKIDLDDPAHWRITDKSVPTASHLVANAFKSGILSEAFNLPGIRWTSA